MEGVVFDEVVELGGTDEGGGEGDREARSMGDLQYFPTPDWLADKAVAKLDTEEVDRVCDACAGSGALADAWKRRMGDKHYRREVQVDCVEIDPRHHPVLREKGFRVVGLDFLEFEGGAVYGAVLLNPPFRNGVHHVLKAWAMLYAGEVVAILNAQTLANLNSKERRMLADIIAKHGAVEHFPGAFKGECVEREADVDAVIVHLVKPAETADDWIGPVIAGMKIDMTEHEGLQLPNELALPSTFVENQYLCFREAVKAMRASVRAEAVASHFSNRIGKTMGEANAKEMAEGTKNAMRKQGDWVRRTLSERYAELKDRAWTSVLRSTATLSKLSQKVQKQAESKFEEIKALDFTISNVYSFLIGLVESQPEMMKDMMCDVFDQISKYHDENVVYYRGWVSNTKHRSCGMRVKTTRFILPGHRVEGYQNSPSWDTRQLLADFDKVFAMLDGVSEPAFGLVDTFAGKFKELKDGHRVQSAYFDLRLYKGIGTIHFFPRRADLMDRLNRMVGRQRAWVPPPEQQAEGFWKQYGKAESFDGEFRKEVKRVHSAKKGGGYVSRWDDPFRLANREALGESAAARAILTEAMDEVLKSKGLLEALEGEEARARLSDVRRPQQVSLLAFDEGQPSGNAQNAERMEKAA